MTQKEAVFLLVCFLSKTRKKLGFKTYETCGNMRKMKGTLYKQGISGISFLFPPRMNKFNIASHRSSACWQDF